MKKEKDNELNILKEVDFTTNLEDQEDKEMQEEIARMNLREMVEEEHNKKMNRNRT